MNSRPERLAPDEAFVLVARTTVMVCPFVSECASDRVHKRRTQRDKHEQADIDRLAPQRGVIRERCCDLAMRMFRRPNRSFDQR